MGLPIRVFLVEDSTIIRERLSESIIQEGRIEVAGYADTETDALHALRETAFDAVVLDLQLKRGSGLAVLKAMRAGDVAPPVFIVFTNYDFPHYRAKSTQLGADYFFDKAREYDRVREVLEDIACAREATSPSEESPSWRVPD